MRSQSPALFQPVDDKKQPDLKQKKPIIILESFVEKWEAEFRRFQVSYKLENLDENKKKDYEIYQKQMNILFEKANHFLDGINNLNRAVDSAKKIDELEKMEKQFTIVGPVTRDFAEVYLKYLQEFINLKFSKIEKLTIYTFAKAHNFQTVGQRKKTAKENKQKLGLEIQMYDSAVKSTPKGMRKS